jgi:hypothetical protein
MTDSEQSSTSPPEHPSLIRYRNLGYNILENIDDDLVKDKEIPELGPCSECANNILTRPFNAFTTLSCGHVFHRLCVEKKLLLTKPSRCPFPDCGKNVDIMNPNFTRSKVNDSPSSQSSGISALSNFMGEKFFLTSPTILEDPMEGVENVLFQQIVSHLICAKCAEKITLDFPKDTVFLSCKHAVHYDCIDNLYKRCPSCSTTDDLESPGLSDVQKK